MIYITTIWHTGTHSLMSLLDVEARLERHKEWQQVHCEPLCLDKIKANPKWEVHTTYRDPYYTAISWANRDKDSENEGNNNTWLEQWDAWADIVPYALKVHVTADMSMKLNHFEDKYELHKALGERDWDKYFEHIPKWWIDHAVKCIRRASPHLLRHMGPPEILNYGKRAKK